MKPVSNAAKARWAWMNIRYAPGMAGITIWRYRDLGWFLIGETHRGSSDTSLTLPQCATD